MTLIFKKYGRTLIIVLSMILTMVLLSFMNHSEVMPPVQSFDTFPMQIKAWHGTSSRFDQEVYEALGVDHSILANYINGENNASVQLYVGYYQTQREGDLIHSPKNCMPGSGWNITRTEIEPVELKSIDRQHSKPVNAIKLILEKGSQKQMVLYWFQSRGRIISSEYMQKIWLVVDSIIKQRTDGSFVRFIAPIEASEEETLAILKGFIQVVSPYLNQYIPS